MLRFFTRLEKTRNFVLFLFAILMVGSLVFFYTPQSSTSLANLSQSTDTAASVSGNNISIGEIVRQKENMSRFMRGQSSPTKTVLDGLIDGRIRRIEAERLGLTASDKELADEIYKQYKGDGEDAKPFDKAVYEQNVIEMYGNIQSYEQRVRDDLSSKKLEAFLTSGVTVSEQEVLDDFQRRNTKFDLTYVSVSSADVAKTITPTDQELKDYFAANKQSYYISVPQKKIRYVFVNTSKMGEKLKIEDSELQTEYEGLAPDKKMAGVLGQEIVLRIAKPEFDGQIQEKASDLVARLKEGGTTVTEEAFAEMAKGHSENPATASLGGKLPGPVKENPNKKDDPYQRLLRMKPGDITEPISYQGRYFILRRGEDVPKSFEEARKELEVSLRNRKAYSLTAELAQKVADSLKVTKDPQKTAQEFAGQANMSATDMVRETGYVKPGDDVPNIGTSPQFESGIATLENPNDVGDKTPVKDGFAIPMLVDKKEPRDAEFDEVKAQVTETVKTEKARAQVEEIAKQIATGATSVSALDSAATGKGLKAKDQKGFVIGSPIGEGPTAGTNEALEDAIYAMKNGEVTKTPLKVGDNWVIVGVANREDADNAEFTKQRSNLIEQMQARKRSTVFADYMAATKHKFETAGYIKIYKDALDKIDAPDPNAPPAANTVKK
ncbi:MAG: peptidyl-prolyl cis-trans isomerase [Chloracidobacterium sp.]|nr:peptidyl-prolyl cis-trans isomerase [Chloracidobacterium sp.]